MLKMSKKTMSMEEILNNCKKFNNCWGEVKKKHSVWKRIGKEYGWFQVSDKEFAERENKIIRLLEKIGFKQEVFGTYISQPMEEDGRTVYYKVYTGSWKNNSYGTRCGEFRWEKHYDEYPRTIRVGEIFYENGMMKTMTARGVWTGD